MSEERTYPDGITAELLMAYADNALAPDDVARVERALAAFPELAREVEDYRMTAEALSGAFDDAFCKAPPAHFEALVVPAAEAGGKVVSLDARRGRIWRDLPVWGQAIAACAIFSLGALVGGSVLTRQASEASSGFLSAGRLDSGHPVAIALESTVSASPVDIPGGRFDAVATFPTASGDPCREFEGANRDGAVVGIACRRPEGWTVELVLRAEPAVSPEGGFSLASGVDNGVIEALLGELEAGVSLSADEESCLIEAGWKAEICN